MWAGHTCLSYDPTAPLIHVTDPKSTYMYPRPLCVPHASPTSRLPLAPSSKFRLPPMAYPRHNCTPQPPTCSNASDVSLGRSTEVWVAGHGPLPTTTIPWTQAQAPMSSTPMAHRPPGVTPFPSPVPLRPPQCTPPAQTHATPCVDCPPPHLHILGPTFPTSASIPAVGTAPHLSRCLPPAVHPPGHAICVGVQQM